MRSYASYRIDTMADYITSRSPWLKIVYLLAPYSESNERGHEIYWLCSFSPCFLPAGDCYWTSYYLWPGLIRIESAHDRIFACIELTWPGLTLLFAELLFLFSCSTRPLGFQTAVGSTKYWIGDFCAGFPVVCRLYGSNRFNCTV